MTEIPTLVYILAFLVAAVAAAAPVIAKALAEAKLPSPAVHPVVAPTPATPAPYSRAQWVIELVDLATEADRLGQADVATAARALTAALIAVKTPKETTT